MSRRRVRIITLITLEPDPRMAPKAMPDSQGSGLSERYAERQLLRAGLRKDFDLKGPSEHLAKSWE